MNKKIVIFLAGVWTNLLILPIIALADFDPPPLPRGGPIDILKIFKNIFGYIWPLFIGFAILIFIFSGYMFLTAKGDPGKIKLAKDAFIWGVVGVGVALISMSVILTVISLL